MSAWFVTARGTGVSGYTHTFTYDPVGNRLTKDDGTTVTTSVYDAANRLQTAEDGSGVTTYTFDANGNQRTQETPAGDVTTYVWNYENELASAEDAAGDVTTYTYTAAEQRVGKETDTETVKFLWDGQNIVQEYDESDVTQADYTNDPQPAPQPFGNLVSQRRDTESSFYSFDALGSTRNLTDDAEVETDDYTYEAFGKVAASSGTTENPFQWVGKTGYYADEETSLYSLRRRQYGSGEGRFVSEDPTRSRPVFGVSETRQTPQEIKNELASLYEYAGNTVTNLTDPSGLEAELAGRAVTKRDELYNEVVTTRLEELAFEPLTLLAAIQDGDLTGDEIKRLALTAEEIEVILGSSFRYTLPEHYYFEEAQREYPDFPPIEAYKRQVARINYARARLKLAIHNTNLKYGVEELYRLLRAFNPTHFIVEKGAVVVTGREPVLGNTQNRAAAAAEIVLYIAVLKGTSWTLGKLRGAALAPLSSTTEGAVFTFPNGGRLTVRPGESYSPKELEAALTEAASGARVTIFPRQAIGQSEAAVGAEAAATPAPPPETVPPQATQPVEIVRTPSSRESPVLDLTRTVRFLRDEGVSDLQVRRVMIESGFRGPIENNTPITLARFRRLFPQTLQQQKSFSGRLGDIETRVATLREAIQIELAGQRPDFEFPVHAASGSAYVDVVALDPISGQPVRAIQIIRALPRAGGRLVFKDEEQVNALIIERGLGGQFPEFVVTGPKR